MAQTKRVLRRYVIGMTQTKRLLRRYVIGMAQTKRLLRRMYSELHKQNVYYEDM